MLSKFTNCLGEIATKMSHNALMTLNCATNDALLGIFVMCMAAKYRTTKNKYEKLFINKNFKVNQM